LVQTKLRVGPAGDAFEQEADRMADRALDHPVQGGVQRQADPEEEEIQAKPLAASITPLVQRTELYEEEEELQAAPTAQRAEEGFDAGNSIEQRLASLRGSGSPLPDELRADMESRFGTDFRGVRLHTDAESDTLNRDLQAKAFTHKTDIYFSSGQYEPDSRTGKHLLAHELTHVVQQTGSGPQTSSPDAQEQGQASVPSTRGEPAVQRVKIEEIDEEEEEQTQSQGSPPLRLADRAWVGKGRNVLQSQSSASPPPMLTNKPRSEIEEEQTQSQGSQPLMLTDRPWSEIEEEQTQSQGSQPLMLTDRPWSEIEEEQTQSRGSQPLMLTDRPWSEIEEEQTQSQGSQPLMLTDRPWSEIEKERSPVRKLLQSERPSLPQMPMPNMPNPIQIPPQSPRSNEPLMLTDKPWSEMEKEKSREQPAQDPAKWKKGAKPKPVPKAQPQIGTKGQAQQAGGAPQISEPKAKPGQEMTGMGPDLWAENLMRQHSIDPKDWAMLGKEQQTKLVSDITSGNPKRAKRTLGKAQAEREGKAPGAWETWKAGWGAFFKETIPSKLSAMTPTSTSRAQQRALANRRKALGSQAPSDQAPGPQPAKSNIGTIEQYLKERKAAKEEKAKSEEGGDTASKGSVSGLEAGIKIGELQSEVKTLRAKVEELEKRG
jgi:hypothetical protein